MAVLRSDIEKALKELISNEEGTRFQGLAVVLAKEKFPYLVASERKKDLGRDAYAPDVLAEDGRGRVLASSLTAEIGKIKSDLERARQSIPHLEHIIFYTAHKVTEETKERWSATIRREYDAELIVISREDIITDLMRPSIASVCESMLGIPVHHEPVLGEIIEKTGQAISELRDGWMGRSRFAGRPEIELDYVRLGDRPEEPHSPITIAQLEVAVFESQRVILEGSAGSGKTTTLIQLANRVTHANGNHLAFLINLPEFLRSGSGILDFIAAAPPFLFRRITAANLASVCGNVHCSFLLNGWNEISDSYSEDAVNALAELDRSFPTAGIILATRTHHVRPPLTAQLRVRPSPLTRTQRAEYLRRLLPNTASELLGELEGDPALDDLTRIPLILAEMATLFQAGKPLPRTKMAVLGAATHLIEASDEHRDHLERAPVWGRSREYLTELAEYVTAEGETNLSETTTRAAIHSVSQQLHSESQIANLPEPADILSLLCAHHVLERVDYPALAFRFQHQQFQEFYAALALNRQLSASAAKPDFAAQRSFARDFINKPAWEESFGMLAEALGRQIVEGGDHDSLATAKQLVELALAVDPIFAADLSRLGGDSLWQEVGSIISDRLRSWRADNDPHHSQCALAGMLASGSADFSDILLPLLTSDDQQIRLRTYRAWHEFHICSLGRDWHRIVEAWDEDCRADFIGEVAQQRQAAEIAEHLALTDPSGKVRLVAVQALFFSSAVERLRRVLSSLDDPTFREIVRKGMLDRASADLRPRVLSAYKVILDQTEDSFARLRIVLAMTGLGEPGAPRVVLAELSRIPPARIPHQQQWYLHSVIERLCKLEPECFSVWVADRLIDGTLSGSHWLTFVRSLSDRQRRLLLEAITGRELTASEMNRHADLAAVADAELCRQLFSQVCAMRSRLSALGLDAEDRRRSGAICRQIEDFLRKVPPLIALTGITTVLSTEPIPTEYDLLTETLASVGDQDFDLRTIPDHEVRRRLRGYLISGISRVLEQEDYSGNLKGHTAIALARIGEPENLEVLRRLIRADIDRRRVGLAARLRGDRGPIGNGAIMSYSNWHVRAVCRLGSSNANDLLIELLNEREYEQDAAIGLLQLAYRPTATPKPLTAFRPRDYAGIWIAREAAQVSGFDEERRRRFSDAIRNVISKIMEDAKESDPAPYGFRAKKLAGVLAVLDPKNSAEFVLKVMEWPSRWDEWDRVRALQALLFGGARLKTQQALAILEPVIDRTTREFHDQQQRYLLAECLPILAFVDEPSAGIARIREVLATTTLHGFELRELISALARSRCEDTLELLLDIGRKNSTALRGAAVEWINAVALLGTWKAKQVLLSFVDPETSGSGVHLEDHELRELASRVSDMAREDQSIKQRLFSLCSLNLDGERRPLLIQTLAILGTQDAIIAALELIRDDGIPPVPFELVRALETLFVDHRPYGESTNTYTLEPRDVNAIRRRLFEMVLSDERRKRSAWSLLGQIEIWRLEYGRPAKEPRHPDFDSGLPWPPIGSAPRP